MASRKKSQPNLFLIPTSPPITDLAMPILQREFVEQPLKKSNFLYENHQI